jgi:hypothetical protein
MSTPFSATHSVGLTRRGGVWCASRSAETERSAVPKFVIEREIAGAGKLLRRELQAISHTR